MASVWFLKLALNCFDHFAWPLLALGYPLCASVQAIETDSYTETRNLISYWILLSLIYLFEYAFLRLLQWFQFWLYIKLMIVFWLIIPDFGRASYVYNHLIHSLKPQAVISRLNNCGKLFVKKESFLQHAEIYIEENGTEALEKLIASKNTTCNPDAEATNAIRATDKKETQQKENPVQTNGKSLQTEPKDIKDLEVIEKKEIPAGKQDINVKPNLAPSQSINVKPNLAPSQSASSAKVEIKGMGGKDTTGVELPQSSTDMKVQKEWTCAVCQVTTTSERTLNSHLHGRKHKASCEALKAKNQPVPQKLKSDQSKEELKQKNIINQHANVVQKNIQISPAKEQAQTSRVPKQSMLNYAIKQVTIKGQENKTTADQKSVHTPANKTDQLNDKTKNGESTVNKKNLGKPVGVNRSKFRCEICSVTCTSEVDMASHFNGRKHLAQIQT